MKLTSLIVAKTLACSLLLITLLVSSGCGKLYMKDIATDALDPNNLSDTEPSIAVNPQNSKDIAIVSFSENWNPSTGAPVWKSSDRGVTWRKVFQVVQPAAGQWGPGDQKIDYDANGSIYVAELAGGSGITDYVFRQTAVPDAALTPGAPYGNDQPHL